MRWCNAAQRFEHRRATDVAGVDDDVGAAQRLERLLTDKAVSVRNDADLFVRMTLGHRGD